VVILLDPIRSTPYVVWVLVLVKPNPIRLTYTPACTNNCRHNFTVVEGESMTILEAIREAISRGWSNIIFESDSKVVVEAIKSNPQGRSELCYIIVSIKALLQCNSNFEITIIFWSRHTYFNNILPCIDHIIINEMS
jgi:hypothetical protein